MTLLALAERHVAAADRITQIAETSLLFTLHEGLHDDECACFAAELITGDRVARRLAAALRWGGADV